MYKSCSRCGKIHDTRFRCNAGKTYKRTSERSLRNKYVWHKKSEEIRNKAEYLCEVCRDKGVYTYEGLEVHHIEKLKDREDLLLDDYNLICLCSEHHHLADSGKLDKKYLQGLAKNRESKKSPMPV